MSLVHFIACRSRRVVAAVLTCGLLGSSLSAAEPLTGAAVYKAKCASCHGASGEGKTDTYPHPLVGDRSIGELSEYIAKTMPEDKPGTCTGDEAKAVAQYIHETFYSATAQARNKPARVELSRLTVRQYRNAVADLIGRFRATVSNDDRPGLNGKYYRTRSLLGESTRTLSSDDIMFERCDPQIQFDFKDQSPDPKTMDKYEFSIDWEGSVYAPDTGEYEFMLRTEQAAQLWVNDLNLPLVDVYVKSSNENELKGAIYLVGGRLYPIRLGFSKAKQGVRDRAVKERPSEPASVSLLWKRPQRVAEVVPAACLFLKKPSEQFALTTPFPPDDRSHGWEKATSISTEWDQATTEAAIEVATYVDTHLEELSGVSREATDFVAKLKKFCERMAEYAFRRPLDDELLQVYIESQFASSTEPEIAVNRIMLLLMKSPRFLYREVGGAPGRTNDPYDVASRISFALWDSAPDEQLLQAAARGELATRDQVLAQARRMATDLRARSKVREFLMRWLKVDQVPDISKDPTQFPEFNDVVASDLRMSLELFLDDLLASESPSFRQLLLSDKLFLNGRLAKFYGANLPEDALFQPVSLESSERAGVLSHPYLMADFAYEATSSPIHRGVFIARSLLGRTLRPPPEAVTPEPPTLQPDLTTRDRIAAQTKPESCQTCHAMINPLGFSLEEFDAVGRFRKEENGKPVLATGFYRTRQGDTVEFNGVRDLANFLADSSEVHSAFVEQLFHAMVKQPIRAYGSKAKEDLKDSFVRENLDIRKLLVQIVTISALTNDNSAGQTTAGK